MLSALLLISCSLQAQDRIYLDADSKDGKVIEITADRVKYKNPLNPGPTYSVGRNKVLFMLSKDGKFLCLHGSDNDVDASKKIERFLDPAPLATTGMDQVLLSDGNLLRINMQSDDDAFLYYKDGAENKKIEKGSIAMVIFKDGSHKLYSTPLVAADALTKIKTTTIVSAPKETPVTAIAASFKPDDKPVPVNKPVESAAPAPAPVPEPAAVIVPVKKTATILLLANKTAVLYLTLQDSSIGSVKAGGMKKIELPSGSYSLLMDDHLGNQIPRSVSIQEGDFGKSITIAFPDIDYAALRDQKHREALATVKALEPGILQQQQNCLAAQTELLKDSTAIRMGQKNPDAVSDTLWARYNASLAEYKQGLAQYTQIATAENVKENIVPFKQTLAKDDKKLMAVTYLQQMRSGKRPMSGDLITALNLSRASDLHFFIPKDSAEDMRIENITLIDYAIQKKCDTLVLQYLVAQGVDVNTFGRRLTDNKNVYASPLAEAALAGNMDALLFLIRHDAKFYPPHAALKEQRTQIKYIVDRCRDKNDVLTLLRQNGFAMEDYTEQMRLTVQKIAGNMVAVDSGTYTIGCILDPRVECRPVERPSLSVHIQPFRINKYEVTRREWKIIMEDEDPSAFKDCEECPVEQVTYDSALAFIRKLNQLGTEKFRLPTEAEWEYACAGGPKANGNRSLYAGSNTLDDVAWTKENCAGSIHPVGQKKPNEIGLYDMSGNVLEWCADWYSETAYAHMDPNHPVGPTGGFQHVLRGGSFMQSEWSAQITRRSGEAPALISPAVGFRLAMDK